MIHSMTAYARVQQEIPFGQIVWEVRSVNHRFIDVQYRLPDPMRVLEQQLRDLTKTKLHRGKIDCNLAIQLQNSNSQFHVNQSLVDAIFQQVEIWEPQAQLAKINPIELLQFPGVLDNSQEYLEQLQQTVLDSFKLVLDQILNARQKEGQSMTQLIVDRLDSCEQLVRHIADQMPAILAWQKERITTRLEAAMQENLEPGRIEQEIVLLANKIDVQEELDRLNIHLKSVRKTLEQKGACGRKLDFIMQELNREVNTIASKSINAQITDYTVDLKVLIEQMREQIQNVE